MTFNPCNCNCNYPSGLQLRYSGDTDFKVWVPPYYYADWDGQTFGQSLRANGRGGWIQDNPNAEAIFCDIITSPTYNCSTHTVDFDFTLILSYGPPGAWAPSPAGTINYTVSYEFPIEGDDPCPRSQGVKTVTEEYVPPDLEAGGVIPPITTVSGINQVALEAPGKGLFGADLSDIMNPYGTLICSPDFDAYTIVLLPKETETQLQSGEVLAGSIVSNIVESQESLILDIVSSSDINIVVSQESPV